MRARILLLPIAVTSALQCAPTRRTPHRLPRLRAATYDPQTSSNNKDQNDSQNGPQNNILELNSEDTAKFDYFDHWYPIHVLDTMDDTRPHAAQLLGLSLVLWKDGDTWRAFEDSCPHRRGALSEGRVEDDGSLLCSYHGWRFDGDGACSSLPYAPAALEERQRRGARCGSYPTAEADGLLWVFPRPDAFAAAARPLPLVAEQHEDSGRDWQVKIPAGTRDFVCGWDSMVENTLDPSHFCAAHHNTLGNRYEDPRAYEFRITRKSTRDGGFALDGDMGELEFVPPCLVKYKPNYAGMPFEGNLVLATYCVPTAPGKVRPLATVLRDRATPFGTTRAELALAAFMGPVPAWVGHVASSVVLHQDAALLYSQFRNLLAKGYRPNDPDSTDYNAICHQPAKVDRGVTTFRRWLAKHGSVSWACDETLPPRGSEDVFDMWDAHTTNCRYCTDAYNNFGTARDVAAGVFIAGACLPDGPFRAPVVALSALTFVACVQARGLFRRYEFSHAEND